MNYGKNVWQAVVLQTLLDAEYYTAKAHKQMSSKGYVEFILKEEINQIDLEIKQGGFEAICGLADIQLIKVKRAIREIKVENDWYGNVFASSLSDKYFTRRQHLARIRHAQPAA